MEIFIILFKEKLNIKEIRNTKLKNQNVKSEYFDIINEKIKNTQGLWKKKKEREINRGKKINGAKYLNKNELWKNV